MATSRQQATFAANKVVDKIFKKQEKRLKGKEGGGKKQKGRKKKKKKHKSFEPMSTSVHYSPGALPLRVVCWGAAHPRSGDNPAL